MTEPKKVPFWWSWPSIIVEFFSGLVTDALAVGIVFAFKSNAWYFQLPVATGLSCVYERFIDKNGWSWKDVGERMIGIVFWLWVWHRFGH